MVVSIVLCICCILVEVKNSIFEYSIGIYKIISICYGLKNNNECLFEM